MSDQVSTLIDECTASFHLLDSLLPEARIAAVNAIRQRLACYSPMQSEPVDCVLWVPADSVSSNDYNPNTVAPPEMELLRISIEADGYTQPIVTYPEAACETVVDGFHRSRVGKECQGVRERCLGHLPVARINPRRGARNDRIASTIRHNRARGKHGVEEMSRIITELVRRNWTDQRIAKELGMEADEVLRLKQVTGLAEMFRGREFSEAWEAKPQYP